MLRCFIFNPHLTDFAQRNNDLCSEINSDLSHAEKFAYIIKISQNSRAITTIHEELKNLHSSWILPEVKTFTNEIINSALKDEINIILSDNYSFLESNLGKKFEDSLEIVYGSTNQFKLSDNHSFILPKIEFSNPLNWTIIVHEAGHLQNEDIRKLRDNPDIIPDNIQSLNENIIKNWAEEIYCDIYATSLLGPAYFISFVSFALLSTMDFGISANSSKHPSVIIRASIIINYLTDNNLVFKSSWGINDYCYQFYEYLIDQNTIFKDDSQDTIKGLTKFNRNLRKAIKELNLNSFSIGNEDALRISNLLSNLKNGIPIGSVHNIGEIKLKYLLNKNDLTNDELNQLKYLTSERRCKIWEILNVGWIFKLENCCKIGESIFFNEINIKEDIIDKIDRYGNVIDSLDERLLSSINTSQIIKIIEGN